MHGARSVELGYAPTVKSSANLFRTLCYNNKDQLMAGIIVAGWDNVEGGCVYSVPIGGALVKQPFAIGGALALLRQGLARGHASLTKPTSAQARGQRTFTASATPTTVRA